MLAGAPIRSPGTGRPLAKSGPHTMRDGSTMTHVAPPATPSDPLSWPLDRDARMLTTLRDPNELDDGAKTDHETR